MNAVQLLAIKEEVRDILKKGNATLQTMDEIHEWRSIADIVGNIKRLVDFALMLVLAVEVAVTKVDTGIERIKGGEKLNIAADVFNDVLNLPWYWRLLSGPLVQVTVSMMVEVINRTHGKSWDLTTATEAISKGKDFLEVAAKTVDSVDSATSLLSR